MAIFIPPFGNQSVSVPAGSLLAVYTQGTANVNRITGGANYPDQVQNLGQVVNTQTLFGTYTTAVTIQVEAIGGLPVYYEVGTSPAVGQFRLNWCVQPTPATLNATGTLGYDLIRTGIVTSTTAAAVTATLATGAVMDASSTFAIGDAIDFTVINTGGTNAFTVTAASGHTVVGNMGVAANTTGRFRTTKTGAQTFVTYRLS